MSIHTKPLRRSLRKYLVPTLACALTATVAAGVSAPAQGAATGRAGTVVSTAAQASGAVDIRAASFNIQSVGLDRTYGQQRPWRVRRATVISQILSERVDVIGVQEAAFSTAFGPRLVNGATQYLDLRNGLNGAGGSYQLTNKKAVNCVRPYVSVRCQPRDQDASASERILYNTRTLSLVRRNSLKYTHQSSPAGRLYLAWAVLRSKATGDEFLFTTTHLDPSSIAIRQAQWKEMIRTVTRIRGNLPVISVGDYNAQKFNPITRTMLPAMRNAGIGDVLNQQYRVNPSRGVRAERRVNAWLNTYNHLSRNVADFSYETRRDKTGNGIDYIFASNRLRVKEYKVVLRFDPRTLRVIGYLPSDHNMIRATITLP
jgi:endonuclease/exonuclease/phosphatase family metal-dependent hydrolase